MLPFVEFVVIYSQLELHEVSTINTRCSHVLIPCITLYKWVIVTLHPLTHLILHIQQFMNPFPYGHLSNAV